MAEGRSQALWSHTSAILALTANIHRDRKRRAMKPADFNPHAQTDVYKKREREAVPKVKMTDVKHLLLGLRPVRRGRPSRPSLAPTRLAPPRAVADPKQPGGDPERQEHAERDERHEAPGGAAERGPGV